MAPPVFCLVTVATHPRQQYSEHVRMMAIIMESGRVELFLAQVSFYKPLESLFISCPACDYQAILPQEFSFLCFCTTVILPQVLSHRNSTSSNITTGKLLQQYTTGFTTEIVPPKIVIITIAIYYHRNSVSCVFVLQEYYHKNNTPGMFTTGLYHRDSCGKMSEILLW